MHDAGVFLGLYVGNGENQPTYLAWPRATPRASIQMRGPETPVKQYRDTIPHWDVVLALFNVWCTFPRAAGQAAA